MSTRRSARSSRSTRSPAARTSSSRSRGSAGSAPSPRRSGIGVDADQSYLGPHIATSALKKVDVAVFQTIQDLQAGGFNGGEDTVFDVASGAVGIGEIAPTVPADAVAQVKRVQEEIAAGTITDIPATVKAGSR